MWIRKKKWREKEEKQGRIMQEKFYCRNSTARLFGNQSGTGIGYREVAGLKQMLLPLLSAGRSFILTH